MKRAPKAALGLMVIAAAGLTVYSAAAHLGITTGMAERRAAMALSPLRLDVPGAPTESSAAPCEAATAAENEPATPVPAPSDLKVTVRTTPRGPALSLQRKGHLVTIQNGHDRQTAVNEAVWTQGAPASKLVWETTNVTTLETVRGTLTWNGQDTSVAVGDTVSPGVVDRNATGSHVCEGHSDGATGFVVVCRVNGQAAGASTYGKDPREGVWSLAGDKTLIRFDLPMEGDGVDTKVVGYEKAGKGVLVRVEASRAPGEKTALLAIGSDGRAQPQPVRRVCCFKCRLPERGDL